MRNNISRKLILQDRTFRILIFLTIVLLVLVLYVNYKKHPYGWAGWLYIKENFYLQEANDSLFKKVEDDDETDEEEKKDEDSFYSRMKEMADNRKDYRKDPLLSKRFESKKKAEAEAEDEAEAEAEDEAEDEETSDQSKEKDDDDAEIKNNTDEHDGDNPNSINLSGKKCKITVTCD